MLSRSDFKPVTLDDKPLFDEHYRHHPPVHSDNVLTTMVSWSHYMKYKYAQVGDNIIIMTIRSGEVRIRPPSGPHNVAVLHDAIDLAKKEGTVRPLAVIDVENKAWISQMVPSLNFSMHRDFSDYVYLASDLAELEGKSYLKIRNHINRFRRENEYGIEQISCENLDEVSKFLRRWCLWKDCESDELLENERKAIKFSMAHFLELGLSGIALRINDEIEGIAVYEKMSPDTAVVHYEKAIPDFKGIYQVIMNETAKILAQDFHFINRESDMGSPGLREAKRRLHPHHMVDLYHVDKDDLNVPV